MNGVQTRLKCKPNVKRCKRFVFPVHSPLLYHNTLTTKAIKYFQADHILTRFVFPPLNIPDGTFHVPGVIYKVSGDRLDIFSYKGEKPVENSPLFLAPFFNVTGSSVCLGNATLTPPEDMTFSKLLEYWEKRFWLSEFSHLGGSRNPTGSNLVSVTEKARANPFDENELKPMNKQLKDLLA